MSSRLQETHPLLRTLLEFRLPGSSQYVELPRVTLLGSSDSAKRTVIMALTGLPLPEEYLGTEFTMEFIVKPSEKTSVKMSVLASRENMHELRPILALNDEVGCEDSDWEGLFEFLFSRLILELREFGIHNFSVKDVIRVEVERPSPGSMVILDLPQWPSRNGIDNEWFISEMTKASSTIIVGHDNLSTLKQSRLDHILRQRASCGDCGNRTMVVFVARAANLTARDALQVRAIVQKRCRGHDFSFGWFVLEDREVKGGQVQRPYYLDGFDFRPSHPETDSITLSSQSRRFFNHVKSKLEQHQAFDVPKLRSEIEKGLLSERETLRKCGQLPDYAPPHWIDISNAILGVKSTLAEMGSVHNRLGLIETSFHILKSFDSEDASQSLSSAASTTDPICTPTESSADEADVHDASERTSTPTPKRRG